MAVKLGYSNIYRDPLGYPEWQAKGYPVKTISDGSIGLDQAGGGSEGGKDNAYGLLYGWAMIWTLLGVFVGGMALNLTPCVYPLIPIIIS